MILSAINRKKIDHRLIKLIHSLPVNLDKETADQFKSEILALIVKEVSNERKRAVELCKKRAELWKNSMGSQNNAPKIARDEARSRYNEAVFLADLIELKESVV